MRRPGIWVANGTPTDPDLMYQWNPGSVTCIYDYLQPNLVYDYKVQNPDVDVIFGLISIFVATGARLSSTEVYF